MWTTFLLLWSFPFLNESAISPSQREKQWWRVQASQALPCKGTNEVASCVLLLFVLTLLKLDGRSNAVCRANWNPTHCNGLLVFLNQFKLFWFRFLFQSHTCHPLLHTHAVFPCCCVKDIYFSAAVVFHCRWNTFLWVGPEFSILFCSTWVSFCYEIQDWRSTKEGSATAMP